MSVRWDKGVKFLFVLSEFCCGMIGWILWFINLRSIFIISGFMFDIFLSIVFVCKINILCDIFFGNGLFILYVCDWIKLCWSVFILFFWISILLNFLNLVVIL